MKEGEKGRGRKRDGERGREEGEKERANLLNFLTCLLCCSSFLIQPPLPTE